VAAASAHLPRRYEDGSRPAMTGSCGARASRHHELALQSRRDVGVRKQRRFVLGLNDTGRARQLTLSANGRSWWFRNCRFWRPRCSVCRSKMRHLVCVCLHEGRAGGALEWASRRVRTKRGFVRCGIRTKPRFVQCSKCTKRGYLRVGLVQNRGFRLGSFVPILIR
jgi:hypothetical protein